LQVLLKKRFKLAFHVEKREVEGYIFIIGKHGERLRPSFVDPVGLKLERRKALWEVYVIDHTERPPEN